MTPLYIACANSHDEVVQVLLDHGAQVDVLDKVSDISCIHVMLYKYLHVHELCIINNGSHIRN